jgi:hypothetical protein
MNSAFRKAIAINEVGSIDTILKKFCPSGRTRSDHENCKISDTGSSLWRDRWDNHQSDRFQKYSCLRIQLIVFWTLFGFYDWDFSRRVSNIGHNIKTKRHHRNWRRIDRLDNSARTCEYCKNHIFLHRIQKFDRLNKILQNHTQRTRHRTNHQRQGSNWELFVQCHETEIW